jgi:type II secretory pathway pseudopilin PulG
MADRRSQKEEPPKARPGHPLPSAICRLPSGREEGFTLAALLVILTIMSIMIAYTVPTQWSLVMRREREKQTIYLMKQYARGILNWERKFQGLPTSLDQLREAKQPRMLRGNGKWPMPLTGREDDWIMVPPTAIDQAGAVNGIPQQNGVGIGAMSTPQPGQAGVPGKLNPAASPKDYSGVFVAVRPNASGPSLISLNGAEDYSQWVYTLQDLKTEIQLQQTALSVPK